MSRLNDRAFVEPVGFDGSATITTDTIAYFVAPRACFLKELWTLIRGTIDFTTGDEQARVLVDYALTVGGSYTSVHTETLANANTWTAGTPRQQTISAAEAATRIPAGAVIRVTFDVAGTTPSFANVHINLGLQFA